MRLALSKRVSVYNAQLQMVEDMERAGHITCIRPLRKMEVGRMERDTDKLERLYEEGYHLGEVFCQM